MKVEVRFFAVCRDIAGRDTISLELPVNATGELLWERLIVEVPRLEPYKAQSRLAVNLEYAKNSIQLKDGDEISIIPPVSGG